MRVPISTTYTKTAYTSSSNSPETTPIPPPPSPGTCFLYEPKSVLEHRRSPSSVANNSGEFFQLENHHVVTNPQLEDWDSWMRDLGLNDDDSLVSKASLPLENQNLHPETQSHYLNVPDLAAPPTGSYEFPALDFGLLSDFPVYGSVPVGQNSIEGFAGEISGGNLNVGLEYVDELIRLAEYFETNSVQLGQLILARLHERLRSPVGKPLQRAAFYFKEALQSLLTGTTPVHRAATSSEIIQTIKAQKLFAHMSPIPMFSSFTANQAFLEATDGAMHIHVVDFDIGFGGQWASFMKEIAEKAETHKSPPPMLRISAVVTEEYEMESNLVRENLTQFARELNIRFDVDFISIRSFEYHSFKAIKFIEGEKIAVVLSPTIFREIGPGFLNDLRRLSPLAVVHVDVEGQIGYTNTSSYRQTVINGLEFYSTLLESIETAANSMGAHAWDWLRKIETYVIYPKITAAVEAVGWRGTPAREALMAAGLRPIGLSQFTDFQAEYLLRKVQIRGFHAVKRQNEMLLCWHERPVASMSAWRY